VWRHQTVSRSVAREAIRVLESMGMVESRRRVGITIQPADKGMSLIPG
jgi:DNA-binding FadR family transcriptional regulator